MITLLKQADRPPTRAIWFPETDCPERDVELVRQRRYGVIETAAGRLVRIRFKPWPRLFWVPEAARLRGWLGWRQPTDFCQIYFNQPLAHPRFLALKHIESTAGTTLATFRRAVQVLDAVAEIKESDAIVAHVTNSRISDRLLRRWGWEPHCPHRRSRHFIKRYYGVYPSRAGC